MARQSAVSKEAREYIIEQIKEEGLITVEEVVEIILPHYCFDPVQSKQREVKNVSRRILASIKDSGGIRTVLAVKGSPGLYADIRTCKDLSTLRKIDSQLTEKYEGLRKPLHMVKRRVRELEGQLSLFVENSDVELIEQA